MTATIYKQIAQFALVAGLSIYFLLIGSAVFMFSEVLTPSTDTTYIALVLIATLIFTGGGLFMFIRAQKLLNGGNHSRIQAGFFSNESSEPRTDVSEWTEESESSDDE